MRPSPLRRGQLRASEDGGARRPAALAETSGKTPWIAEARRQGHGRCVVRDRTADRLAGDRAAAAGQYHRRLIGVGHAGLGPTVRHERTLGSGPPNRRWRCLHIETRHLHVDTLVVSRSRHQISTYRHRCLDLETACRSHKCYTAHGTRMSRCR